MRHSSFAQLLAIALASVPTGFVDAMKQARQAQRDWQPTEHHHRSHAGGHAGQLAKRKARNRRRNKIARASRRANRA